MGYQDFREYLAELERRGKLHRIGVEVDRNWEIAAVCRRVFQRIPEPQRPAVLFEKIKDSEMRLAAGVLGASREIYALAMQTTPDKIAEGWKNLKPIEPELVKNALCQEVVLQGDEVDLEKLPIPVWTREHDPGPYLTSPFVVSMDPDTGVHNVGTYRMQAKGKNKTGLMPGKAQHMFAHINKYDARNEDIPVAIVLGADPAVGLCSVAKLTHGPSEYAFAGGLRGEALPLVKCKTIPIEVPATSEIVLEGTIPANYREKEGPFGEYTGYMGASGNHLVVNVKCITHRRDPIYQAFVSQMPPSESSCIRGLGRELPIYRHLTETLGYPVKAVHLPEGGGSGGIMVISMDKQYEGQVQQVVWGAWSMSSDFSKYLIIVDSDIDVYDWFQVQWAMSFRTRPARDIYIYRDTTALGLDPSMGPPSLPQHDPGRMLDSRVAIDATKKHQYPPVALPPKEDLDKVDADWKKYGF